MAVILIAVLAGPRSTPAPQLLSPPEEGWTRLRIAGVGSIDYPSGFLELQSGEYRQLAEIFGVVYEVPTSDFTLQQAGLNELEPSAFEEYRRVIFKSVNLSRGEEVPRANEKYTMSQEELAEMRDELTSGLSHEFDRLSSMGAGNTMIIGPVTLEIIEMHGMFPLVHSYRRQLDDNPVVQVVTYMFMDYDKIHYLTFSCRVRDAEECTDVFESMLETFRLRA